MFRRYKFENKDYNYFESNKEYRNLDIYDNKDQNSVINQIKDQKKLKKKLTIKERELSLSNYISKAILRLVDSDLLTFKNANFELSKVKETT